MTTDQSCTFCKIVQRGIVADEVLRDDHVVAFRDLNPVAPTHVLVVPTIHVAHLGAFAQQFHANALAHVIAAIAQLGAHFGPLGYRVVTNQGSDAGQSVFHLHFHVLAGRRLSWPPG